MNNNNIYQGVINNDKVNKKIDINDIEQVKKATNDYLINCALNNVIPNYSGLAKYLGVERKTLSNWKTGKRRNNDEYCKLMRDFKSIIESIIIDCMYDNKIQSNRGMFILISNYGYKKIGRTNAKQNIRNKIVKKREMNNLS